MSLHVDDASITLLAHFQIKQHSLTRVAVPAAVAAAVRTMAVFADGYLSIEMATSASTLYVLSAPNPWPRPWPVAAWVVFESVKTEVN